MVTEKLNTIGIKNKKKNELLSLMYDYRKKQKEPPPPFSSFSFLKSPFPDQSPKPLWKELISLLFSFPSSAEKPTLYFFLLPEKPTLKLSSFHAFIGLRGEPPITWSSCAGLVALLSITKGCFNELWWLEQSSWRSDWTVRYSSWQWDLGNYANVDLAWRVGVGRWSGVPRALVTWPSLLWLAVMQGENGPAKLQCRCLMCCMRMAASREGEPADFA